MTMNSVCTEEGDSQVVSGVKMESKNYGGAPLCCDVTGLGGRWQKFGLA